VLWRWAGGDATENKSTEQILAEEAAATTRAVRESILWFLRRGLEHVAEVQRGMVEKRLERAREKEKSVLYKSTVPSATLPSQKQEWRDEQQYESASTLSAAEAASIEAQLSAEQLQLFAEENDSMLRHYEDTLSKVQYVPIPSSLKCMH
jgi:hypothetical protein